ncbi:uncharacterized protein LOC114517034 [Dendronephthya gigantea]|uniref:uncharacterized protein LOC114517034 n=1 Tax=Dendronephthya gigantea TaxID=151771 RepID=UPI00106B8263|nr:uncharacterized protein LOC114517034 [Dendronephthya gigantea]
MSHFGKPASFENHRRTAAFTFKKRSERVDWRKLAAVDVNRIARELDFKSLQENIMNITFCNIEAEMDSHLVDPNFVKLFQLSQLIIEYLMHSQQFLQFKINEMEATLKDNEQGLEKKSKELEEKQNSVNHLKKENRKARKMLAEYQLMMRTGASGMHKCPFCPKVFVSNDYLLAHLQRRHPEQNSQMTNGFARQTTKESRPLQDSNTAINGELLQELSEIKERLASTERQLKQERNEQQRIEKEDKEMHKIKELEDRYTQWKEDEQQRQTHEMREFKDSVMLELRQVHDEKNALEQKIVDLQQRSERKSLIRGIQDEDETDAPSSKQQRQDMEVIRRELHQEVNSIQTHAEEEMKKMSEKWRKKENKMKKENDAEKQKYESMYRQFNEALEAERIEKQKMIVGFEEQMNEMNKKIAERERLSEVPKGRPPLAPNTADQVGTINRESQRPTSRQEEPQENDTITLYVAFNGTNYQLRRNSSSSSRDWSDQFSFDAYLQANESFEYPIYVFSAGGSPYWRQYISTNPSPPSSEYRTDYMFYVSSAPLARTIACYVQESGSIPVIKSCISKSAKLTGWRSTGIIFYAWKSTRPGSPTKPLNRSGTFMSDTGTEGDDGSESDDVSVSSLNTATESAKKNLAEAIQINRSKVEELQQQRALPPPPAPAEDSRDSESEENESEEDLGTTLETGTFRPFEKFPEVTTRYNHRQDTLEECKEEVREIFEQSLAKRGIQPESKRLSSKQLESRMESLRSEQEGRAKKFKNFKEIRKRKAEEVDVMARGMLNSKRPARLGDEPRVSSSQRTIPLKPSLKSAASAITAARGFASRDASSRSRPAEPASARPPSDGNRSPVKPGGSFSATSESFSEESKLGASNERRELTDEGSDEDTDWDSALSGDESPSRQMVPKVSVHVPTQRSQVSRVQELASSLEESLERTAENKKPAGAVALIHSTPNTGAKTQSKIEDFDDDSDFLSSSPEPDSNIQKQTQGNLKKQSHLPGTGTSAGKPAVEPSPKKGVKFKMDNFSDFDESDLDIENLS